MRAAAGLLNASGPGANRRVSATVRVQQRERISRARLAADRDEDAAASDQGLEDPAVVRLKADATHRARDSELRQIARLALQRRDERTARDDSPEVRDVEAIRRRGENFFNQRGGLRRGLRENRERVAREAGGAE